MLPGRNYDEYNEIADNVENHPLTDYTPEEQHIEEIVPYDIEGVFLNDEEAKNPEIFWNMSSGKEKWEETASRIAEVRDRLNNGESLDNLLADEQLGSCASGFFDMDKANAVKVYELEGGGYVFAGDGRHRVIAARLVGQSIPVMVIGIRK